MSLAVAFGIGGVALPSVANAAASVSVTTTVDPQTSNTGTPESNGSTTLVNSSTNAAGAPRSSPEFRLDVVLTGPAGLACNMITFNGGTVPASHCRLQPNGSLFIATSPLLTLDPGETRIIDYTFGVLPTEPTPTTPSVALTGTLSSVAQLDIVDTSVGTSTGAYPIVSTLATGNTATTELVAPEAPTFNAAPPAATIYQSYSYTLAPAVFPKAKWTVYRKHTNNATPPVTTYKELTDTQPCGVTPQRCIVLDQYGNEPALLFNTTTRVISGSSADLDSVFTGPDPLVFVANNKVGGATAAAVVSPPGDGPYSVLPVKRHDVSMTATIPVLFSDVLAFSSGFGPAIYSLAGDSVIQGYGDGTFRPNITVTRQAFVHFAAQVINNSGTTVNTGPCNASTHPSAFSDVPNSSAFCQEIQDLSTAGVVNGYTDGTFGPTNIVSRQAISAFLYRVDLVVRGLNANTQGDAQCTGSAPFNDVAVTDQFCGDISWMADNGIAAGYSDGGFHPLASSSRQATASFLYKLEIFEGTVTP